MKPKYEYLENGEWIQVEDWSDMCMHEDYKKRIIRATDYKKEYYLVNYSIGDVWHRLDGPAFIRYDYNHNVIESGYWLNDVPVITGNKIDPQSIFERVKKRPYLLKEMILLARHHKWLNEDQILLLKNFHLLTM